MNEFIDNIPEAIVPLINMAVPNEPIPIYKGDFQLIQDERVVNLNGEINFEWFPVFGAVFSGEIKILSTGLQSFIKTSSRFGLYIGGLKFGDGYLTEVVLLSSVRGTVRPIAIYGDQSVSVNKVQFSIPNLKSLDGEVVKVIAPDGKKKIANRRLVFDNSEYLITIDKCVDYDNLSKSLDSKGGYIILYNGELSKKKGSIYVEEVTEVAYCFSTFLSFLNGRRCSPLFLHGIYNNEVKWIDFSHKIIDQNKSAVSWTQQHSIDGLNELWQRFSEIWKVDSDKDFLISVIHWYIEANNNSGFMEGSIVMAQTALELLYNWHLIEKRRLLAGKDVDNLSAANKMRLLISSIGLSYQVPEFFTTLREYIESNSELIDGIDAIVSIRNAIIHSQEDKRKKLMKLDWKVKYEALQLSIWYIELLILNILQYTGKYFNRSLPVQWAGQGEEYVPWINAQLDTE